MSERAEERGLTTVTTAEAAEAMRKICQMHDEAMKADPLLAALWNQRVEHATAPPWKRLWWRLTRGRPWWEKLQDSLARTPRDPTP